MANNKTTKTTPKVKFPTLANLAGSTKKAAQDVIKKEYQNYGLQGRLRNDKDYEFAAKTAGGDIEHLHSMLEAEKKKDAEKMKKTSIATAVKNDPIFKESAPGNYKLVKFKQDPDANGMASASTLWLVSDDEKLMRPILSEKGLQAIYPNPEDFQDALNSINEFDVTELEPGGKLGSYLLGGQTYAINDNGRAKPLPEGVNPGVVAKRYGKPSDANAVYTAAAELMRWKDEWTRNPAAYNIDSSFVNKMMNDPLTLSNYLGAMAYGDYTAADVFRDVKRGEQIAKGNTQAKDWVAISSGRVKNDLMNDDAYWATKMNPILDQGEMVVNERANINTAAISSMADPDGYWKNLNKGAVKLDFNSPEVQAEMDKVKSTMHDLMLESLNANTEQDKKIADQKWAEAKIDAEKSLAKLEKDTGITIDENLKNLSYNLRDAWDQLQNAENQLAGSGNISAQAGAPIASSEKGRQVAEDVNLANQRAQDQLKFQQEDYATNKARGDRDNSMANASPEEIQRMNDEDKANGKPRSEWRSVQWGLAPAEEMTKEKYLQEWKTKHAGTAEANLPESVIIDKFYNQEYDQNGNKWSGLYLKKAQETAKAKYGAGSVIGSYTGSYSDYQTKQVQAAADAKNKAEKGTGTTNDITDTASMDFAKEGTNVYKPTDSLGQNMSVDPAKVAAQKQAQINKEIAAKAAATTPKTDTLGQGISAANTAAKTSILKSSISAAKPTPINSVASAMDFVAKANKAITPTKVTPPATPAPAKTTTVAKATTPIQPVKTPAKTTTSTKPVSMATTTPASSVYKNVPKTPFKI